MTDISKAGRFTLGDRAVHRMGYGAMQLAGPGVWGPPRDREEAQAVLRAAVEAGVDHIDTSDFYGPHVTNEIIADTLHPYAPGLTLVTKIGAERGPDASWNEACSEAQLIAQVHDNLRRLKLDVLDVVNFRRFNHGPRPAEGSIERPMAVMAELQRQGLIRHIGLSTVTAAQVHDNLRRLKLDRLEVVNFRRMSSGPLPQEGSIEAPMTAMAELQRRGLVRHIGLSTVTAAQVAEARRIAPVVCVQNLYNIAMRGDDALIDELAAAGIAYVPYFPLRRPMGAHGVFAAVESPELSAVARELSATPMQVALAWLLHRSRNILVIPGTSSLAHLGENLAAAELELTPEMAGRLDAVGTERAAA